MDRAASVPHNRLGLDYRQVPGRKVKVEGGIIDAHNHTREPQYTQTFVDAAAAYGVTEFYTMCPLEHVAAIKEKFPGKFHFIAVPAWAAAKEGVNAEFMADWRRRTEEFARHGAKLIKFHAAPGTCRRWGITLDDPRILDIAKHAYDLGYHFMTHVGDPKAWFYGSGRYADGTYGTLESQFDGLERMLERYPDRIHLGAHMGGSLENLDLLAKRLDRFPNYVIDMSATKWIVRAVAEQPTKAVRDFILHYQDRIVWGSDLVVGDKYDWDHYASRYWVHLKLWETDYRGQSPIEDPDAGAGFDPKTGSIDTSKADGIPHLMGLDLPAEVLQKLYRTNAERWLPR
jgi:predicted TIM-barrel fold metal-dependent hydrolase